MPQGWRGEDERLRDQTLVKERSEEARAGLKKRCRHATSLGKIIEHMVKIDVGIC